MHSILWTDTAQDSYLQILDFLFDQWSLDIALDWDGKVQQLLNNISTHKELCPASEKFPGLRRCIINEYTSLIYRVKEDHIELITFFDNRANHPF